MALSDQVDQHLADLGALDAVVEPDSEDIPLLQKVRNSELIEFEGQDFGFRIVNRWHVRYSIEFNRRKILNIDNRRGPMYVQS